MDEREDEEYEEDGCRLTFPGFTRFRFIPRGTLSAEEQLLTEAAATYLPYFLRSGLPSWVPCHEVPALSLELQRLRTPPSPPTPSLPFPAPPSPSPCPSLSLTSFPSPSSYTSFFFAAAATAAAEHEGEPPAYTAEQQELPAEQKTTVTGALPAVAAWQWHQQQAATAAAALVVGECKERTSAESLWRSQAAQQGHCMYRVSLSTEIESATGSNALS